MSITKQTSVYILSVGKISFRQEEKYMNSSLQQMALRYFELPAVQKEYEITLLNMRCHYINYVLYLHLRWERKSKII